jgi:hypothetical protein
LRLFIFIHIAIKRPAAAHSFVCDVGCCLFAPRFGVAGKTDSEVSSASEGANVVSVALAEAVLRRAWVGRIVYEALCFVVSVSPGPDVFYGSSCRSSLTTCLGRVFRPKMMEIP